MVVHIQRDIRPIKNGYSASALGLAAHGYSPEVADINLERTIRLFLAPFEREHTLAVETERLGLPPLDTLVDVTFQLEWDRQ